MTDSAYEKSGVATLEAPAVEAAKPTGKRARRVIWLLLSAAFVMILNETIMAVALSELMDDLNVVARTAQWLTTAFMLTMAVVIPITGFLLQRFNTRPIFMGAMGFFSLGTLTAASAPGFEVLLAGRILQACGTAVIIPLLMNTIMTLVPAAERGKMMGNISIVISVAPAIGPTISGVILSVLDWRWMFLLILPIALVATYIGYLRIENVGEPKRVPIDVFSVVLSALGFGGLLYGLSQIGGGAEGGTDGGAQPSPMPMWIALGVGLVSLVVFVLRQIRLQREDRALLDLRTFKSMNFSVSIGMIMISMGTLFGTVILLPIYTQKVLELSPLFTGLLLLPGGLVMGLMGPIVGRIFDRFGPRVLLVPGALIMTVIMVLLTFVGEDTSPYSLLAGHMLLSAGLAALMTPLFTAGLGSVRPDLVPHGSAILATSQQVAGAAGTALFVTVMAIQVAASTAGGASEATALTEGVRAAFFVGIITSVLAVIAAFFVRKPEEAPEGAGH
ncbi:MDR family MFS transporter [Stackebrandtia nassauensis]|uniref:Drug resistance transporter, EmrB/QacA subfamily n=1 Tax=Stackebrandtia nassauensis (strain DSM 44728 / CIP 108903 / NRRL B-16338 / NBRC 102104 / LLR-40K-21) TaxID=446470 RepID=D3PW30_STANL|nr:MDR family MFS transporter [Stackebrandtia nassauensis]ADD45151.1 drug resistance transporter, EmrB/QacA subfamily [Stackebrandtia nassauensis DSM 44728]